MGRVDDDQWLDKALNQALHSDDTRPDFRQWIANHPEAVEMLTARTLQATPRPLWIRRILMNATVIKLAAAAVIALAAMVGITQLTRTSTSQTAVIEPAEPVAQQTLAGPMTHQFADGSRVKLAEGATIRTLAEAGKRGFEHLTGRIDVSVAKGKGEFIVMSPYGQVKALGTQFTMDLVDGVAQNTRQPVKLLSVQVTEGSVEVRNAQGASTVKERQNIVVTPDAAPYDFSQDGTLPARLKERIAAMSAAIEAGDSAAWIANFNTGYMYKLIQGQEPYDAQRFGGTEADLEQIRKGFSNVASAEELVQRLGSSGLNGSAQIYIRSATVSEDGRHAQAECVHREKERTLVVTTPEWHFFDNDWWQVDD